MRCFAKKKAMYTAIEKVAALFCDKIICISDAEKQSALDKKICKEDKLQVVFNGVDIDLRVNEHTELEIFAEENPPKRVNRPEACGLRHLAFCVDSVLAAKKNSPSSTGGR